MQIGLERRAFDRMHKFKKFNGHVRQFLVETTPPTTNEATYS